MLNRTQVMGIVNVTPDSFSDGGRFVHVDAALTRAQELIGEGADILDIGGESTRPGAQAVDPVEEQRRILPVIRQLADAPVAISVDTFHPETAEAALKAGAHIINDVSAKADPTLLKIVAEAGVPYILQHSRGNPATMTGLASYDDVVKEVTEEWKRLADKAHGAGITDDQLIFDPGLGFAKNSEHNWTLLRQLPALMDLGYPVLIGASRKRFLGEVAHGDNALDRDNPTHAISMWCALHGVWAVRVHDVSPTAEAIAVAQVLTKGKISVENVLRATGD